MADTDNTQADNEAEESDDIIIGVDDEDGEEGGAALEAPAPREATEGLKRAIFNVPIEVVVSVGVARPLIGDLLEMGRDHLMPIDSNIDDPVELRVKGRVIARGELTQTPDTENQLGVRVTEILNMAGIAE